MGWRNGFGVVFLWKLEVLAILKGKRFHPVKGGNNSFYHVLFIVYIDWIAKLYKRQDAHFFNYMYKKKDKI